jgi:hypothetical protein
MNAMLLERAMMIILVREAWQLGLSIGRTSCAAFARLKTMLRL